MINATYTIYGSAPIMSFSSVPIGVLSCFNHPSSRLNLGVLPQAWSILFRIVIRRLPASTVIMTRLARNDVKVHMCLLLNMFAFSTNWFHHQLPSTFLASLIRPFDNVNPLPFLPGPVTVAAQHVS
jgi:hypothetical protein